METLKRMVLSQVLLADTFMCAISSVLVIDSWIAARSPINWQHWQDIERGQMFVLPVWQELFDARLILAQTGRGNVIPGGW